MSLLRILLILAAAYIAWRLLQRLFPGLQPPPGRPPREFETMARCTKCGTYVPQGTLNSRGLCGRCAE
ncbi:MAG: hypothetical protein HYV18_05905 [Gammaproteobacteria bacterium]|nr:hypothetical protein [Gammaproteobacteria bacterium]